MTDAGATTNRTRVSIASVTRGWRRSRLTLPAAVGGLLLLAFVILAVFAPQLAPYAPNQQNLLLRLQPPMWVDGGSADHILGTDQLGRDIFSRVIFGTRVALIVGFGSVALATLIGTIIGLVAGYYGGISDTLAMRLVDAIVAIPNVILYLTVLGVFDPSIALLIIVIGVINWTTFARVVRAEVLSIKQREFIEAVRALGLGSVATVARHVLPNVAGSIMVVATLNIASVIVLEAGLSYLGFGVQAPTVTWGRMLSDGRAYMATAWWLATFPGLAITLLTLAFLFLGDWLRDLLDPRQR